MQRKKCSGCGKTRVIGKFDKGMSTKDGYRCWCKECKVEYDKKYYQINKKVILEKAKKYRQENKEYQKKYNKKYRQTEKGKEARKRYRQSEKGKETVKHYQQSEKGKKILKRCNQKIQRRIAISLRARMRKVLKGVNKSASTIELLGCSIEEFLIYIESRFEEDMTRKNYGSYWELDHIIPCSKFDLTKVIQQKKCFHYSNLRPLYWKDNLKKYNKVA